MTRRKLCIWVIVIALILIVLIVSKQPVESAENRIPVEYEVVETIMPTVQIDTPAPTPEPKEHPVMKLESVSKEPIEAPPDYADLVDMNTWGIALDAMARTLKGEYNAVSTADGKTQAAAVCWCIMNRAETWGEVTPDVIVAVISQPGQFAGYNPDSYIETPLREIAADVLGRWLAEQHGIEEVGRVLPKEYCWFHGNGRENIYRDAYSGGNIWEWLLTSPYKEDNT